MNPKDRKIVRPFSHVVHGELDTTILNSVTTDLKGIPFSQKSIREKLWTFRTFRLKGACNFSME